MTRDCLVDLAPPAPQNGSQSDLPPNIPSWFLALDVRGKNKTTAEDCLSINI